MERVSKYWLKEINERISEDVHKKLVEKITKKHIEDMQKQVKSTLEHSIKQRFGFSKILDKLVAKQIKEIRKLRATLTPDVEKIFNKVWAELDEETEEYPICKHCEYLEAECECDSNEQ